ncbi:MAG: hypothetical protein HMLKMBBP_03617 [Planctomycetes bacterium]|nr:hypothetical protein [Planctomycetota bacterium]
MTGLAVTDADLAAVIRRTHLRGWRMERRQGFGADDYAMPADVHLPRPEVQLPHFNTAEFFAALRERVMARFDEMARDELRADA